MTASTDVKMVPKILVLGTADWDQAIATNQHYVVRELLQDYPLTYSESFGLRRPEFTTRDLTRMARRLLGRFRKTRSTSRITNRPRPAGLDVVSPVIIPFHSGIARHFNTLRIRNLFREWINYEGPRILWTYTPLTYGLEKYAAATIYHCVDLLGEFPGVSPEMVANQEARLASSTRVALASSEVVERHLEDRGFADVRSWPNVADVETISQYRGAVRRNSQSVVFAGNLSKAKIDFDILERIAQEGFELHLAGPIAEGGGDATSEVQRLVELGAKYHGLLSLDDVSKLYWNCSVGLIPYTITPYTLGVNPLKTYEYLAAGMGVVSTAVPAVKPVPGHVSIISTLDDCVFQVRRLASSGSPESLETRFALANENSWSKRGEEARSLLAQIIAEDRSSR